MEQEKGQYFYYMKCTECGHYQSNTTGRNPCPECGALGKGWTPVSARKVTTWKSRFFGLFKWPVTVIEEAPSANEEPERQSDGPGMSTYEMFKMFGKNDIEAMKAHKELEQIINP